MKARKSPYFVQALHGRMLLLLLLLGTVFVPILTGCGARGRNEAESLVTSGSLATGALKDYYNNLADKQEQWQKIDNAVKIAKGLTPPSNQQRADDRRNNQAIVKAFRARANMAGKAQEVYTALSALIDKKNQKEVASAAISLKDQIVKVNSDHPLKLGPLSPEQSSQLLEKAVKHLVKMQQMRQFRALGPEAVKTLQSILEFYDYEKIAYYNTEKDFNQASFEAVQLGVNLDAVRNLKVFQPAWDLFQMQPIDSNSTDPKLKKAVLYTLEETHYSLDEAAIPYASSHSIALYGLAKQSRQFLHMPLLDPNVGREDIAEPQTLTKMLQASITRAEAKKPAATPPELIADYIAHRLAEPVKESIKSFNGTPAQLKSISRALPEELNRVLEGVLYPHTLKKRATRASMRQAKAMKCSPATVSGSLS